MAPSSSEYEIFMAHFNGPRLPDPGSPGAAECYDALTRATLCLKSCFSVDLHLDYGKKLFLLVCFSRESWFQLSVEGFFLNWSSDHPLCVYSFCEHSPASCGFRGSNVEFDSPFLDYPQSPESFPCSLLPCCLSGLWGDREPSSGDVKRHED